VKAVADDAAVVVAIAFVLLCAVCAVWVIQDSVRRWCAAMRGAPRPARVWDPQCQANVRAYWRGASGAVVNCQPAVRDALAILRDAEERLEDYGPHDM